MIQPVNHAPSSPPRADPPSSLHVLTTVLFEGGPGPLNAALVEALAEHPPAALLDASLTAWLERRGRGGATASNALLTAWAARELAGARRGPEVEAAAVVSLGFLQQAAGAPFPHRELPGPPALGSWTGWGDEALLSAALQGWTIETGAGPGEAAAEPDAALVILASRQLLARPALRQVRGLLLALRVSGASEPARERVDAFLRDGGPPLPPGSPRRPEDRPAAVEAAIQRACRLDPRPTLGHALQLAVACLSAAHLSTEVRGWTGAALLASAATWPSLQRQWRAFPGSSQA